jgi:hypothetical protein
MSPFLRNKVPTFIQRALQSIQAENMLVKRLQYHLCIEGDFYEQLLE